MARIDCLGGHRDDVTPMVSIPNAFRITGSRAPGPYSNGLVWRDVVLASRFRVIET
jgi:hypothetical protein